MRKLGPATRRLVLMPEGLWSKVKISQAQAALGSSSEAIRRLVEIGLRA